jgi:uncharacterized membrane protein HdeD (DUF308 family)
MKTVLRVAILVLCVLTGLVVTGHGIVEAVLIRAPGHEDIMRHLLEGSISIAGGACVVAVAIDQLECLRTHRKSGDIL